MTGSTHKTLPGPQHGILLSDEKDEELIEKFKIATFPSMVSNHHIHNVAGLAVTLCEMLEFGKDYHAQVLKNAKALAEALKENGFNPVCEHKGFTESHQVIVDVSNFEETVGLGGDIEKQMEKANVIINRNLLPADISKYKRSYTNPGGIRLGTSEVTRIGMKEEEMKIIAGFFKDVIVDKKDAEDIKKKVIEFRKDFQKVHYAFPSDKLAYDYIKF